MDAVTVYIWYVLIAIDCLYCSSSRSGSSLGIDLSPLSPHTPQGSPNKSPEACILDYSEASMRNRNLERQVESLEEQLEHQEKELKQERGRLEDQWTAEKQELEKTLLSLRLSLQQREEQIQALTTQQVRGGVDRYRRSLHNR